MNLGIALSIAGQARRRHRRTPRGDPAQARRRRCPLQPRQRPAGPGQARRRHRRIPRGDPAQARHRRCPQKPRHRPENPGQARRGRRRTPRGDPAQARPGRRPHATSAWPCRSRASSTTPSPNTARRSGSSPTCAAAHYNLGNALRDQGKLDEAMAEYRAAIRLQPDFAGSRTRPRQRPGRPGQARPSHRRIPRGDPAPARLRQCPLQPRHRAGRPGQA